MKRRLEKVFCVLERRIGFFERNIQLKSSQKVPNVMVVILQLARGFGANEELLPIEKIRVPATESRIETCRDTSGNGNMGSYRL
jgi:hypothetical protein